MTDLTALLDDIERKLVSPGRDEDKLSRSEHAILLAHEFDGHVRAEDFTSFVFERSEDEWQQSLDALREVGASGYAFVLGRFILDDGAEFAIQGSLPPGSPEFRYSQDYDAGLADARASAGTGAHHAYMERVLLAYARRKGLIRA